MWSLAARAQALYARQVCGVKADQCDWRRRHPTIVYVSVPLNATDFAETPLRGVTTSVPNVLPVEVCADRTVAVHVELAANCA